MDITAVVLTKNEEKNIENCLRSLEWCQEIIVVDDNSSDKTAALAKKYGVRVYEHTLNNDFSDQRSFGLEKAKNEWVLFVDSDEIVSTKLAQEVKVAVQSSKVQGYFISRTDYMWGKQLKHGEQGDIKLLRLARKSSGKWVGQVHETWVVTGITALLKYPLQHYPHQTLKELLTEINFYSTIRSEELFKEGVRANWLSVLLYTKGKFVQDYFFKLGFLDGIEGFVIAIVMSFHSFLTRGKLWQLSEK